jgi:Peptidase family M48
MFGKPRSVLVLQVVLPLAAVVVGYYSVMTLIGTVKPVPTVGPPLFWTLLSLWVVGLLTLVVRPFNVGIMKLLGARTPLQDERSTLDQIWHEVLDRAGVPASRYTLLVVDADDANIWFHRDLGIHVVAIAEEVIDDLDDVELAAVLAQRLARQKSYLALLVGLGIWAAVPLAMILALGVVTFRAIRRIGKAFSSAADGAKPKTEFEAGVALFFYFIGFACFIILLILVISLAIVALLALLVALITAWLARRADLAADLIAVRWGYGSALREGMARIHELDQLYSTRTIGDRVADLFSTYPLASKHLAHLRKVDLIHP